MNWGWGILVNWKKAKINPKEREVQKNKGAVGLDFITKTEQVFILDLYLYVSNRLRTDNLLQPGDVEAKDGRIGIVPVVMHPMNIR